MIGRIEAFVRRLRRGFSRSEWLARLLRLPLSRGTETAPGLVMLQIDGLSQRELERALERGEMPFLHRLIKREHYRLHRQYAGVPATTAAFQGELFYGVKGAVPGFNFMERASGRLVRMFEPAAAARVERELETNGGEPLLQGGSCYVDNYTGGAAEAHFCPAATGWGPALRAANPLVVAFLIFSNAYSFLRVAVLLVLELALALHDFVRGLIAGQDILKELKFVPTRVVIAILLRELATIGAKMDVARGLPVIHLNFLGYDEQAHRRGPSSRFAHWTLKGIDDAIARIWRAAHRSARRHYDVWVYSDHGQERTQPYDKAHGRSFAEAVADVFARHQGEPIRYRSSGQWGMQLQRVRQLGGKRIQRLLPVHASREEEPEIPQLTVAPLGPVAMIYYERELAAAERAQLARALVEQAKAPLVLIKNGSGRARAWSDAGEFALPEDAAEILGTGHPFLDEATQDLIALCHHPDAGDFIACGWRAGSQAYSFAIENGAHGGAGPGETNAFALLPRDIPLASNGRDYLRPSDLRRAALQFLGRSEIKSPKAPRRDTAQTLRVMTYNVHSCIGMDGKLAPERIARVIAHYAPDIVALQELDVGRARTEGADQAHLIARCLEMDFHFHPALHLEEERYGDAILTHLPMRLVKAGALPGLPGQFFLEPRGALWVAIDVHGTEIQVLNTHLGLLPRERKAQVEVLLGPEWLAHTECRGPVILCGDFNALPTSKVCRRFRNRLNDAQIELKRHRPRGTFFGRFPAARIDHVFVDAGFEVTDIEVPDSELARVASDHLPLIVEIKINRTTSL
ncbi:MAG: endonuclease/exonuclease/phosphatase family protein [Gammaproteobacteria bacterium]|nr:endonuclease/exonuclease/phosphatase family protein [Gammaproteobacteria bacterium]